MLTEDISSQISIIERSLEWAKKYGKDTFPSEELKEYRRKLRRVLSALEEKCSAAAYGESQVGKSYLMNALLSTPNAPFVISNQGHEYSFIDGINSSGGNTSKTESTGVITRFTIGDERQTKSGFVKVKNLSIADIVMLLVDSYYNDLKIDNTSAMTFDDIDRGISSIESIWADKSFTQADLTDDDIKDICDYVVDVLGGSAAVNMLHSDFRKIIPPNIQYVNSDNWVKIFSLIWNNNPEFNKLFILLINEYKLIRFQTDVYVPFSAVLREKGTLLKIDWLDDICGSSPTETTDELYTDVFDTDEQLLAKDYKKSSLSALIAELTFVVPKELAKERRFLDKIDLLDFPGARSREKFREQDIASVLPLILRRGKVAYLFNKYSRSLRISAVLFCHHNDQKNQPSLGDTINEWIETNIGKTPEARANILTRTKGISPLFFIATKFNVELERMKTDTKDNTEKLNNHWKRFNVVIPEIINPATWLNNWVVKGGLFKSEAFQNIYLLRDFYWSNRNNVFDGWSDGDIKSQETNVHQYPDYPDFLNILRESFLSEDFVKQHFSNPEKAWKDVATVGNDGSKGIIRDLDAISGVMDSARKDKYLQELRAYNEEILSKLNVYYEPEDKVQNNIRIRTISVDIRRRLDLSIGTRPETFGRIIDQLMVPVSELRKIAYDVVILKTEMPTDFNEIILIRTMVGINMADDKQSNITKLCNYYACDESVLDKEFGAKGFTVNDVVSQKCEISATVSDVVSKNILTYWKNFINRQVKGLEQYLPHSDEVAFMLQSLCKRLGVKSIISDKIDSYSKSFSANDLPNAIADFASLTLNNFVSSVGRSYMAASDIEMIRQKADACNIEIDLSTEASGIQHKQISIVDALNAFDDASDPGSVSIKTLMKLPFWDNFQRWKNLLIIGLLYSSDISHCDTVANTAIKSIIDEAKSLYLN